MLGRTLSPELAARLVSAGSRLDEAPSRLKLRVGALLPVHEEDGGAEEDVGANPGGARKAEARARGPRRAPSGSGVAELFGSTTSHSASSLTSSSAAANSRKAPERRSILAFFEQQTKRPRRRMLQVMCEGMCFLQ